MKVPFDTPVTITVTASSGSAPPVEVQYLPPAGLSTLTLQATVPGGAYESRTFSFTTAHAAIEPKDVAVPKAFPQVGAFLDTLMVFSDAGDGQNIQVQSGPNTFLLSMATIDEIIQGGPDPSQFIAFNIAARLGLSGIASCQSSPGVASAAALALLNSASFKSY